jgi:serine/threonine protein kinase
MSIRIGNYSYNEADKIGQGVQGSVYKGFNAKTQEAVAIKIISLKEGGNEVDSLRKLYEDGKTSPYVMKYYDEFTTQHHRIIITEFVEGLQLNSFINFEHFKNPLNFWRLIYQLLKGVEFIHNKDLAHGDIANVNILLTNEDTVKYVDFGRSCVKECPQVNTDCKNICKTLVFVGKHSKSEALQTSLAEHQQEDLTKLITVIRKLYEAKKKYLKFVAETSMNNSCNLKEVIEDTKTEAFLKEVGKGTFGDNSKFSVFRSNIIYKYNTIGKILTLFHDMILATPFEGRPISIKDLTLPVSNREVNLGNFVFSKKNILSTQKDNYNIPYAVTYLGYNRKSKNKVVIKYMYFLEKDSIGYANAMKEIDVYEKLYENGTTSRYVAKYYGSYLTETGLYIVTEFTEGIIVDNLDEELVDPLFVWPIMYQLLLGLKFIHDKNIVSLSFEGRIIFYKGLIKYTYLEGSCLAECPQNNRECTNLCTESINIQKSWDCYNLYYILKNIFNKIEKLSAGVEYITRTRSFLDKIRVLVKNRGEENVVEKMLDIFREEILIHLDRNITIEEDYADYNDISNIEFNIDSIIAKLNGEETKEEILILEYPYNSDNFSLLKEYYDQIRDMAIDENKLIMFNITLKDSLLKNKQEQFKDYPNKDIFVNFYALFIKILQTPDRR